MAEVPEGVVVITTGDIYRQLLELTNAMGTLTGTVNTMATRLAALDDHEQRLRVVEGYGLHDHDARISSLEKGRWPLPALAILVSIAGAVVAAIALYQH